MSGMSEFKEQIVQLRELSGRSLSLCKEAIRASEGDIEQAIDYILDVEETDILRIQKETGVDLDDCYKAYEVYGGNVESAIKNIENGRFESEYVKTVTTATHDCYVECETYKRDFLCKKCGKIFRRAVSYEKPKDKPSCCGQVTVLLSYEEKAAATQLTQAERPFWYECGAHIKKQGGKRRWRPIYKSRDCYFCKK